MLIYKDRLSEAKDEMLTDIYTMETLHDGCILKVKAKLKSEKTEVNDSMFGGNASAEGQQEDEGGDTSAVSGIDVVLAQRLVEFPMKKKDYVTHIKDYMGKLKTHIAEKHPGELDCFIKNSAKFVKEVVTNFKDWDFYCGETMNADGMLVLCKWMKEEGDKDDSPYLYYFKHGLEEEKV